MENLLPGMDRRIGFAETVNNTTTFYYYLTDHVGTVLRIVRGGRGVVAKYSVALKKSADNADSRP
jgi:hypothetical protein